MNSGPPEGVEYDEKERGKKCNLHLVYGEAGLAASTRVRLMRHTYPKAGTRTG